MRPTSHLRAKLADISSLTLEEIAERFLDLEEQVQGFEATVSDLEAELAGLTPSSKTGCE